MMRHPACRHALLDGDLNPEVAQHLEECGRCRAFARDLAQVSEYARAMAPDAAPAGLADRVIAHVRVAPAGSPGVIDLEEEARRDPAPRRSWPGTQRAPLLATLSVAAVMMLLVGVLAVMPRGGDAPRLAAPPEPEQLDPLLTAAERTLEAGTARVRVSGSATATITPPDDLAVPDVNLSIPAGTFEPPPFQPPPPPDYSTAPPEQHEEMRRQYDAQVEDMRRQYDAYVEQTRQQYEQLRRNSSELFSGIDLPDEFSFEMRITGTGAVEFPDRMRIDGEMRVVKAEPELPADPSGDFGVAVDGDRTFVRSPDGVWVEVPSVAGPLTPVLADPDGVADLLSGARGEVDDLGVEELDGFPVHHYRFDLDAGLFGPAGSDAEGSADVWIGVDDGIVHKLVAASSADHHDGSGFRARMRSTMTLELFDFGADVSVEMPTSAGTSSSPLGPGAVLTPYESDMSTSFFYAPEASEPPSSEFQFTPPTSSPPPAPPPPPPS